MQEFLSRFDFVWAFTGLILGFSFLIFIHELGHHVVAKWVGIKVTQFAIGFGPCVVSWRKGLGLRKGSSEEEYTQRLDGKTDVTGLGETEYRLNWVPLGGYVKMLGQEDLKPDASENEDERSFNNKPIWARACVVSAGVVMNLIFGVVFFIVAFMVGVDFPPAIVGGVLPGSPAAETVASGHPDDEAYRGLRGGDRITAINGEPITDFADLAVNTALTRRGDSMQLTVERGGEPGLLKYVVTPREDTNTHLLALGVAQPISLTVREPSKDQPLAKMLTDGGIEPGMEVVRVDGHGINHYSEFEEAVSAGHGQPVRVEFSDPVSGRSASVSLSAVPVLSASEEYPAPHVSGLVPAIRLPGVVPSSPSDQAGMRMGDILLKVGPITWPTWDQVVDQIQQSKSRPIEFTVLRDGKRIEIGSVTPNYKGAVGIYYGLALDEPVVVQVLAKSPMAVLNLNAGSKILSIQGQPVKSYGDIQRLLSAAVHEKEEGRLEGKPVSVAVGYQVNIANTKPSQAKVEIDGPWAKQLSNTPWRQPLGPMVFNQMMISLKADHPAGAAKLGIKKAHQVMLQTYITLLRLFQGTVKPSHLRGPLGIADDGTSFAKKGWSYLMFFLGLISINLVVVNFLPIPIVDGGLMVFLLIEKLKGSPVSLRIQTAATMVGLAMIGSVFLLTLFYDAKRLLGL